MYSVLGRTKVFKGDYTETTMKAASLPSLRVLYSGSTWLRATRLLYPTAVWACGALKRAEKHTPNSNACWLFYVPSLNKAICL